MRKLQKLLMIFVTISIGIVLFTSSFVSGNISLNDNPAISIEAHNVNARPEQALVKEPYIPVEQQPFFVLVIGNDYRPGVEGRRADGIHVVGVNPVENRAAIINFPRDTNVNIPGRGRNKINAANALGGSDLTRQTIEELMGLKISYTMEVDFAGFTNLVNELGGLDVEVTKPMKDKNSGTNFDPGTIRMDGGQALAFSRDRYSFSDGDISRTTNHGVLLISGLKEMQKSKTSISAKFESASIIARNAQLTNLSLRNLYFLMELASKIDPQNVPNMTVPWSGSNTLSPRANDLFTDFKDNVILDTYR